MILAKYNQIYKKYKYYGVYPDCFRACLASLLGINIRDIPPYYHGQTKTFWNHYRDILKKYNYSFTIHYPNDFHNFKNRIHIATIQTSSKSIHAILRYNNHTIHDPLYSIFDSINKPTLYIINLIKD